MKTIIFGGSFDPPHVEHIEMCKEAVREFNPDRVVIVPTYYPPYKTQGYLPFETRCELCKVAFKDICKEVIIDEIEKDMEGKNYASIILPILKEKYEDIAYIIGGDSLERFYTWYEPQKVVQTCPLIVVPRNHYKDVNVLVEKYKKEIGGEYYVINYVGDHCSSSILKAKLLLHIATDEDIPANVLDFIKKNGLFDEYDSILEQLKSYQTDDLFNHSIQVALMAVTLNTRADLRLDFEKVFKSALLHDNAKQRKSIDGLDVPEDAIGTPVLHQFLGAEKARRDFGIEDEDILNGIRYHTSAKPDMTLFEKLIYTADSVSMDREYDPIPKIREVVFKDFNEGFLCVLKHTYDSLIKRGIPIYNLTEKAYNFYRKDMENIPLL